MKKGKFTVSEMYCTNCGKKGLPIPRKINMQRKAGHLKNIYCIFCEKETNHVEIQAFGDYSYNDFKLEFESGRFVEGQRVGLQDLIGCSARSCQYNVNGKCWNANHSYKCSYRKENE